MIKFDTESYKGRPGTITNQEVISKYSVMSDGRVLNDPSNARKLNSKHIEDQDDTRFDYGVPGFKYQIETLNSEPCLHPLCNWAIAQLGLPGKEGATLKEVFEGAEFVASRGTLATIAYSIHKRSVQREKDSWTIIAQKFGGVILLSEQSKVRTTADITSMEHAFEFKEWMTTGIHDRVDEDPSDDSSPSEDKDSSDDSLSPDVSDSSDHAGPPDKNDLDSSFEAENTFEMMVQSTLSVDSESLSICVAAKIDALRGDDPIELDAGEGFTGGRSKEPWTYDKIGKVLDCEMAGVKSIVFGVKNLSPGMPVTTGISRLFEKSLEELKADEGGSVGQKTAQCYSLLFTVLSKVKQFLSSHDGCKITFAPPANRKKLKISLKKMSREEAKAKGHGVTDEFLNRFEGPRRSPRKRMRSAGKE